MAPVRLFVPLLIAGLLSTLPSSFAVGQSTQPSPSEVEQPISFTAEDSLIVTFGEETTRSRLTGHATVSSGSINVTAHTITLSVETKRMEAKGLRTDSGWVGLPTFQSGSRSFQGESFAYNLRTGKGRIVEASTSIEGGQISGEVIKQPSDSVIYVKEASYTTCPCEEDPQYHLQADRMKILNQNWIFTGPIHLRLFNIPLPIWLPFGFLPATSTRHSGFLPPSYGEDQRGFFLRDWGWYWAINPYMDFQIRFGIWTKGSWQIAPRFRYSNRYNYSGSLSLDWVRNIRGEEADPDHAVVDTRSLRWNHNQTINPTTSLSGDVNLSSRGYLRTISRDYNDHVRQNVSSSINLNKRWPDQGRSLSLSVRQSQHLSDGSASLLLPSLSFSQQSRRPFQHETPRPGGTRWYEKITYSYRTRITNRYQFDPLSEDQLETHGDTTAADITWWDGLISPQAYRRATGRSGRFDFSATHNLPISASFTVNSIPLIGRVPLHVSPHISYGEEWFIRTDRKTFVDSTNGVKTSSVPGFFAYRHFSTGISANTEFYGTFPWSIGNFNGFRHIVRPSWSFTYRPDYSTDFWGYYRTYTDAQGRRHQYPIAPGIPRGKQQTLSFNLTNVLQTKYVPSDTATARQERTLQLLTLNMSTGYNFAADSLRLSPISLNARTRILDKFNVNASARLSPYVTGSDGNPIDRYWWRKGFGLPRLANFRLSAYTSFSGSLGSASTSASSSSFGTGRFGGSAGSKRWSLSLSGHYSYSSSFGRNRQRAVINTNFSLPITETISLRGNTGYDFFDNEIVSTSLSINRELNCWTMGLYWVPIGPGQSFQFTLQVKGGPLSDILRLQIPRSGIKNRFGRLVR